MSMQTEILERIKKRYYEKIVPQLKKEYQYFLAKMKKYGVDIMSELNEQSFVEKFSQKDSGYVLGKTAEFCDRKNPQNTSVAFLHCVDFVHPKTIKIPFAKNPHANRKKGKNPYATVDNVWIEAFGTKMTLRGWHLLTGITVTDINDRVVKGNQKLEDIWNIQKCGVGKGNTKTLILNGEQLSTSEALKRSEVSSFLFYSKAKDKNDEERQRIFDDLRKEVDKRLQNGFGIFRDRTWVLFSDDDFRIVSDFASKNNIGIKDVIHNLVSTLN